MGSEHTLEQRNEEHGGDEIGRGPRVEGVAVLAQRGVELGQRRPASGTAHAAGGEHLPCARRHATGRVRAALARDQRVRTGGEEAQCQLDDGVARAQPISQRIGEGGQPELECHRVVGDVLACDRVAPRGRRHGLAQGHAGLVAHVVLDGLVEAAGAGQADRRVGIAGVFDGERAQHVAEALPERSTPKRCAREGREQQRDAEVGVGAGGAARGAHRGQHRLADPALARAAELGTERDPAAKHVLVGGVAEVVARRDVAGLLGARFQHACQLRSADDLVGAETSDAAGGGRVSARPLLDRHLRHRIAEMSHQLAQPGGRRLDGLRAVVTGASSGIGAAIAEAFGGAGATVLVTHRDSAEAASAVAERIARDGGDALVAQADLGTRGACEALVAHARERLGGLDVWVNNAGADVLTGEAAAWDWERKLDLLLAVDLKGTIACSYAAGAVMREQAGGGAIVNMSWDHVTVGMADEDPELFSAVKGGVLAYSKSLARGLAPRVRVNVLCPGWIETAFAREVDRDFHRSVEESTPLARWGRPEDVAAAALWLASPEAAFVTGQAININGGVVM